MFLIWQVEYKIKNEQYDKRRIYEAHGFETDRRGV